MNAQEYVQAGKLEEALAALQSEVRNNPADPRLRTFLFQLLCLRGSWDRAMNQLAVLAGMGTETKMLAQIFEPVLGCEVLRAEVFAGRRKPILFGEPAEWMGLLLQANELAATGHFAAAQELRDRAFAEAPATSGTLGLHARPADGPGAEPPPPPAPIPFEWIADADVRLGPLLETVIEGHYYWIPFCRIQRIYLERPTDLRDLIWAPAQFVWSNGGEAAGHVPVRYPGTEKSADGSLCLARRTEWQEHDGGYSFGLGQRILATDTGEFPLLECRTVDFASTS